MVQYLQILLNARMARAEQRGATAVEYGLLVALIAAVIIVAVVALRDQISDAFQDTADSIEDRGSGADTPK
ncbi:Flp family type IVb pilin [Nocardioides sambongensis]|uniref:Flp family type IVb pilin n=1 Tax=Nocardioides sambongensis TaxID=2589074 RepID=UPI001129A79F|nr:Flp family type IVb pilin [Nocardioides sambongensis]